MSMSIEVDEFISFNTVSENVRKKEKTWLCFPFVDLKNESKEDFADRQSNDFIFFDIIVSLEKYFFSNVIRA